MDGLTQNAQGGQDEDDAQDNAGSAEEERSRDFSAQSGVRSVES